MKLLKITRNKKAIRVMGYKKKEHIALALCCTLFNSDLDNSSLVNNLHCILNTYTIFDENFNAYQELCVHTILHSYATSLLYPYIEVLCDHCYRYEDTRERANCFRSRTKNADTLGIHMWYYVEKYANRNSINRLEYAIDIILDKLRMEVRFEKRECNYRITT